MKTINKLVLILFSFFLIISCSNKDEDMNDLLIENDILLEKNSSYEFLSFEEAKNVIGIIQNDLNYHFDNKEYEDENSSILINEFWSINERNKTVAFDTLEVDLSLVPENINLSDVFVDESDILTNTFLNEEQKDYALQLLRFARENDVDKLINLKEEYIKDRKNHPELDIFSISFAIIDVNESLLSRGNCQQAALKSAIVDGVIGSIIGSITGGFFGFTIGGWLTGGVLAIPAGGAGAVVGAVAGGLLGFAEGYIRGWITCKIFG
jgi:hypothetical protein